MPYIQKSEACKQNINILFLQACTFSLKQRGWDNKINSFLSHCERWSINRLDVDESGRSLICLQDEISPGCCLLPTGSCTHQQQCHQRGLAVRSVELPTIYGHLCNNTSSELQVNLKTNISWRWITMDIIIEKDIRDRE